MPANVKKFKQTLTELLKDTSLADIQTEKEMTADLSLTFHIPKNFWRKDCSNLIKVCEDCIVDVSGIDDSRYLSVRGKKVATKEQQESIDIILDLIRKGAKMTLVETIKTLNRDQLKRYVEMNEPNAHLYDIDNASTDRLFIMAMLIVMRLTGVDETEG